MDKIRPPFLKCGDLVEIISPSGAIDSEYIDGTVRVLESWGLKVEVSPFARGRFGRFSAKQSDRLTDLQNALDNPAVKAIFCSRGGYGLVQLVGSIDFEKFLLSPKWLIGFSDITVLHSVFFLLGVETIHAIMAKHLTELDALELPVLMLKENLFGNIGHFSLPTHQLNKRGQVTAELVGGNLSVLMGLRATTIDIDFSGKILFVEEVGESPYKVDRMIHNLRMSGQLAQLSGLIVGQFSEYDEDPGMGCTVYELFANAVKQYHYPVCFDFPAGHVDLNLPLVLGAFVKFDVRDNGVTLEYC